jgi:hypothetical protein
MEACRLSNAISNIWSGLDRMPETIEALGAKLFAPDLSERVFAAVDRQSRRHVLIKLTGEEADIRDTQSRGLSVETRALVTSNSISSRYADIVCLDSSGHELFDLLAKEIAQKVGNEQQPASDAVQRVISKWRRFWNSAPRRMLNGDQIAGLFAELWCLRYWLLPFMSPSTAISAWMGPLGFRHDFQFRHNALEVKATSARDLISHRINGIDQLLPPATGNLFFLSVVLAPEPNGTESLPNMVESLTNYLSGNNEAMSEFLSRLGQTGYQAVDAEEYGLVRYRVIDIAIYPVDDAFPRIVPATFGGTAPAGVTRIEYDVSLSGFKQRAISHSPTSEIAKRIAQKPS